MREYFIAKVAREISPWPVGLSCPHPPEMEQGLCPQGREASTGVWSTGIQGRWVQGTGEWDRLPAPWAYSTLSALETWCPED